MRKFGALTLAVCMAVAGPSVAGEAPEIAANPLKNSYFGELHIHTSYSLDSFIFANPVDPAMAYRFARGEPVTLYGGETKQLRRPLDFVAVTDHAEFLGELELCTTPGNTKYDTDMCQKVRKFDHGQFDRIANSVTGTQKKRVAELCGDDGKLCTDAVKSTWKKHKLAAEQNYEPGKFTTLMGYEFSPNNASSAGGFTMLHRNVIFRTMTVPDTVFSAYEGTGEDLHKWIETTCTGDCKALVIPHNSNASSGAFFWEGKNSDGSPWTQEILERRARVEPLVEIFQSKGSSECQAGLGFADEECGFENWVAPCPPGRSLGCAVADSFVQTALVRGLDVDKRQGVNPFKYGFIGATDSHNGASGATEENDYKGELGYQDNTAAKRILAQGRQAGPVDPHNGPANGPGSRMLGFNPGGLAGVWAEKNTRESIWDALARKETFGTSGTRIRVRFFGSFDFDKDIHKRADFVKAAYDKGVPMGGDLVAGPKNKAPTFAVWAVRDPDSAPLQKIQIVKGWVENGKSMLKSIDVACSDNLKPNAKTGLCPDNGATVDVAICAGSKDKGSAELAATWTDPSFNAAERAVYYVRVFENPVCRWSTYQAHQLNVPVPTNTSPTIRERAWSSPIWYTPVRGK
ncbi:MAG: DUF3604 domain-containing protein [Rhodospirillaceae bacterium]|nr:DUF3604 domain-containing protein [Rhodospirillaceae bacterium]